MKHSKHLRSLAFIAAMGLMAACGGTAYAGTGQLNQSFVSDTGTVFNLENALTVEKVPGAVQVMAYNGTVYSYDDATGALYSKVLNAPGFGSRFAQRPGTLYYQNVAESLQVICYGGNQTAVTYAQKAQPFFFADGCAFYNSIKAASN